jgi:6-pyruvoyltetrahydropterin/6-carboxytetrahydropterin synthase
MSEPIFEITKTAHFDAAHRIAAGDPARGHTNIHGHSFRVEASVRGPRVGPAGWVADLNALQARLDVVAGELDHGLLNDQPGLESPTLENLCLWFAERLRPEFPGLSRVVVSRPTIRESCGLDLTL